MEDYVYSINIKYITRFDGIENYHLDTIYRSEEEATRVAEKIEALPIDNILYLERILVVEERPLV